MVFLTGKSLLVILISMLAFLTVATASFGDEIVAPKVDSAVRWSSADGTVEIILTPVINTKSKSNYRLLVISAKELQVSYHTSINSTTKVDKILTPLASTLRDVKVYEFSHAFSRTTIWMALSFSFEDKALTDLTRTFYDGIEHTIRNEEYQNPVD